ncbi:MAG: hypothetical protein SGILL_005718 [Bacillariaceae sp.]
MITPPISLLACQTILQKRLYQIGFTLTGILLGYAVLVLFKSHFYPRMQQYSWFLSTASLIGGFLAVVGVIGQGVITLHLDFLRNIKSVDGVTPAVGMTPQDMWHQQLALVFFVGAAVHTYATTWFSFHGEGRIPPAGAQGGSSGASPQQPTTPQERLFSTNSRLVKTICVIVSLLSAPIAEMYHPTRQIGNESGPLGNKRMVNVIGLTQYLAVGAYIIFFGSYSLDLRRMRQLQQQKAASSKEKKHG